MYSKAPISLTWGFPKRSQTPLKYMACVLQPLQTEHMWRTRATYTLQVSKMHEVPPEVFPCGVEEVQRGFK